MWKILWFWQNVIGCYKNIRFEEKYRKLYFYKYQIYEINAAIKKDVATIWKARKIAIILHYNIFKYLLYILYILLHKSFYLCACMCVDDFQPVVKLKDRD